MAKKAFVACAPEFVKRAVERTLSFRHLNDDAERDVYIALNRVTSQSQRMLVQLAEDARVPDDVALERLACLWVSAAAINLADDLADGDCDYLEARTGPGVSFLLQSLANVIAARCGLSAQCLEEHSTAMTRAASGQSLEVRTERWDAARYLRVAGLIAGEQYGGHLRLLWHGTQWQERALPIGRAVGVVGIAVTDVATGDRRFTGMSLADRTEVLSQLRTRLDDTIDPCGLAGLKDFAGLARTTLARAGAAWSAHARG